MKKLITAIGGKAKTLCPRCLYSQILAFYHFALDVLEIPKICIASWRICRSVATISKKNSRVRFGFYVISEATFQMRSVFTAMLSDDLFDPFIVVVPMLGGDQKESSDKARKTYDSLVAKYPERVFEGIVNDVPNSRIEQCDACAIMNPYRHMTNRLFTIEHFACCGKPVFMVPYSYFNGTIWAREFYSLSTHSFVYRFFCSNEFELACARKYNRSLRKQGRVVITGNPKTDGICERIKKRPGKRTVLIAPHHSVVPDDTVGFNIGNFLTYSDLILSLPSRYPEIRWIFRPHPLLQMRLINDAGWTQCRWHEYVDKLMEAGDVVYDAGGSYYDSFGESDAMIQDCGSFLPEYFFTGKPQCYLLANEAVAARQFDAYGQTLLSHVYKAYSARQILDFIDEVVIAGHDTMKGERDSFAKEHLMVNHPHVGEAVLKEIKIALRRA